jgi:hypothetical protein
MIVGTGDYDSERVDRFFIQSVWSRQNEHSENPVVRIVQYKGAILGSAVAFYYQGIVLTSGSSNK